MDNIAGHIMSIFYTKCCGAKKQSPPLSQKIETTRKKTPITYDRKIITFFKGEKQKNDYIITLFSTRDNLTSAHARIYVWAQDTCACDTCA